MKRTRMVAVSVVLIAACSGPSSSPDVADAVAMDASSDVLVSDVGAESGDVVNTDAAIDVRDAGPIDASDAASEDARDAAAMDASDAGRDVAADAGPDAAVDVGSDIAADIAVDAAADIAVDTASDAPADIAADTAIDVAPDVAAMDAMDVAASDAVAGADADADVGAGSLRVGQVGINQVIVAEDGATTISASHTAGFIDNTGPGACAQLTEGACLVTTCPPASSDGGTGMTTVSAGAVTIGGGTGADLVLLPNPDGTYNGSDLTTVRWRTGDAVSVRAAGAVVPMFTAALTFPAPVTVSEPVTSLATVLTVNRARDFTARWTATDPAGRVQIGLIGTTGPLVLMYCDYPASAGAATIPAATLARLPAGRGALTVGGLAERVVAVGTWQVRVAAQAISVGAPTMFE